MRISDTGSTSKLGSTPRPVVSPTRPLDPKVVETSTLIKDKAISAGSTIYNAFDRVVHDPKLATGIVMSAGAAFAVADKLNSMRNNGQSLSTGGKMQNAGNVLFPLAGAIATATGHNEIAALSNKADAANRGVKKTQEASKSINDGINALKTVRDGAAPAAKAAQNAQGLSKLGKLAAGADVARGVISGVQLAGDIDAIIDDPGKLKDPKFAVKVAYDTLGTANGAVAVAKLAGKTGLVAKINPITGLAFSAAGVASNAIDIKQNGLNLNNGLGLASNALDLAGNAMIMSGVGAPVGMILKGVGAGIAVAQLAVQNWDSIKAVGAKVGAAVGNATSAVKSAVSDGAKAVASTVSNAASSAISGAKNLASKVFSGW